MWLKVDETSDAEYWCRHCCVETPEGRWAFWTVVCPSCMAMLHHAWSQPFIEVVSTYGPSGVKRTAKGINLHAN